MVSVAKAVVDVSTMMIKLFDTRFTVHAMESAIRFDDFAVKAEIFKVDIFIISNVKHFLQWIERLYKARLHTAAC